MHMDESGLVRRYRLNYRLRGDAVLTEQMILDHWNLERALTKQLLESDPDRRHEIFAACYTRLYQELGWLNAQRQPMTREEKDAEFASWCATLPPAPKKVYEIGSGNGELLAYLAERGYECVGSEITSERGKRLLGGAERDIGWHLGDGVNLSRFESAGTYDVVISRQLIEHLHPDDIQTHFAEVHKILRPGGCYVFSTPHRLTGPHDVSRIFNRPRAEGMHLREFTYRELFSIPRTQGFRHVSHAGQRARVQRLLGNSEGRTWALGNALGLLRGALLASEVLLRLTPRRFRGVLAGSLRKLGLFTENVFLVAER